MSSKSGEADESPAISSASPDGPAPADIRQQILTELELERNATDSRITMNTRITLNTRHSWSQLSPDKIGTPALLERMNRLAEFDYRRYSGRAHIKVIATDLETGDQLEVVKSDRPEACPYCGHAL